MLIGWGLLYSIHYTVLLCKATDNGIIIPCPQIVGTGFLIEVFAAVAEGIGVCGVGRLLYAEGVVVVFPNLRSIPICELYHVPMGIVFVIDRVAVGLFSGK